MGNFAEFYFNGGLFMHVITLVGIAATGLTLRAVALAWFAERGRGNDALDKIMRQANGLIAICIGCGALGLLSGLVDTSAAVQDAPPELVLKAALRGMGLSMYTLMWSLILVIPLSGLGLYARHLHYKRGIAT